MNKTYLPTSYLLSVLNTQILKMKCVLHMKHANFIALKFFFCFSAVGTSFVYWPPCAWDTTFFKLIVLRTCVSLLRVEYIKYVFIQIRFTGHQNPINCLIKGFISLQSTVGPPIFCDHNIAKIFEKRQFVILIQGWS